MEHIVMKLSSYRKTMAVAIAEAQMVSDISGISIPALKRETAKFNIKVARVTPGGPMGAEYEVTFTGAEKDLIAYAKEHFGFDDKPGNFMQLKKHLNMSYNDIEEISDKLKLKVLARNIKKLKDKFLKKTIPGTGAMFAQKEEVELDEGKMKTIATMFDQGKSAEEIAKALKLPVGTVKSILGEANIKPYVSMQKDSKTGKMNYVVLDKDEKEAFSSTDYKLSQAYFKKNYDKLKEETIVEFSDSMLDKLKKEYEPLKGKTISVDQANKLRKIFNMIPDRSLDALRKKKIPFLSGLALSRMIQKGMPVKEELELEEKIQPFMISYSKNGQHAGFEGGNSLSDIQNKAQKLRAKGFTIDKMGRYNPPVKDKTAVYTKDNIKNMIKEEDVPKGSHRMPDGTIMKDSEHKKDNEKKESENKDNTIASLKDQIAMLKTKLENEKNKAIKPEPNPDTGEVPLTVGVAYKHFKDKKEKEVKEDVSEKAMTDREKRIQRAKDMIKYYDAQKKAALKGKNKDLAKKMLKNDIEEADLSKKQIKMVHKVADDLPKKDFKDRYGKEKGDAVRFGTATNMVKKKLGIKEDKRLYVETIAGLKKKAEKSGMPYSILKKVYDRGMAAWKSGHRPGASQQQWAFARVNSFVTKSSGTWGGADKDLAKQVRGK